jgi:glyoxylase-like metal-dependent hydrolase (beta-lactamase superfamily II)
MPKELFKNVFFLEGKDFDSNSVLFAGDKNILIDPGFGKETELKSLGLSPESIDFVLLTHCHADHFASATSFRNARILASEKDALKLLQKNSEATAADFFHLTNFPEKISFVEEKISLGKYKLEVIETPGHTDGSVSFYDSKNKFLACGDLFFLEGIGRFDLPTGNEKQLLESIKKIEKLDLEVVVPGHGPLIQGRQAIKENFKAIKELLGVF